MNSRKLLAFILVFSLATQPCGVRFTYAEGTKAAEVKIEKKTEVSDELAIELDETELDEYLFDPGSREQKLEEAANVAAEKAAEKSTFSGALAGAIAAGVAAVTAAVGAAGLMIYNGVSNKDEIEKLWTSEEDSFFSRLGKTVSILLKGGNNCRYGENEAGDECLSGIDPMCKYGEDKKNHRCLAAELADEDVTPVDEEELCEYGEDEKNHCCLATKPANEIASLKDYQQKEEERLAQEEAERKAKEEVMLLKNNKTVLRKGVNSLKSRIDALNEEHKGDLQDELNTVKNTIENALTVEALEEVEGQLTTLEGKVAEAEAVQQKAEEDAKEQGNGKLTELNNAINEADGKGGDKLTAANDLKTELTNALNGTNAQAITDAADKVDGAVKALNDEVAEQKEQERKAQELEKAKQAGQTKLNELKDAIANAGGKGGDALENANTLKTVLTNALNAPNATAEAINTAASKVDDVVKALNDEVAEQKEQERKEKEERKAKEEAERLAKEEAKRETRCPLSREAIDLIEEKNSALNTLNKLKDSCGLDTVGFKRELRAIDLWTLTTPEELAQAEIKLNSIINRINGLRGNCFAIKSDKDYIVANLETVVSTLDQSDCSLRNEWNKLKELLVTEGNLEDLANKYEAITYRVDSIIRNNNDISKFNIKISNFIENNKDAEWFDADYYSKKSDDISKMTKTEESLERIIDELDLLYDELQKNYSKKDIKAVNNYLSKIDNSAIVKGTCTQSSYLGLKKENKLTSEQCNTLKDKFVAERDRLVKNANSNHSLVGLAQKLKNLYGKTDEYINDVAQLNDVASEINKRLEDAEKLGLIEAEPVRQEMYKNKEYSLDDLKTKREAVTKLLNSLSTYTSDNIRDIKAVLALIKDTLSDKNLTRLKGLSKNFKSDVDGKIAVIKSRAKADCSLDGVISNLSTLSGLCKETASKSGELIEKVTYAKDIMEMQKSFNVKIEPAVEGRYGITKIAPTNTKELNGKIPEMNDLLKDLNEEQWGKVLESDKGIRKAANGNQYKLRQYKKTLEDLRNKFSRNEISLKDVINQLERFTFN